MPVLAGGGAQDAAALLAAHPGGILVKAVAGGGGRGIRIVRAPGELDEALAAAAAEAGAAFGADGLIVERYVARARHVEVQIAGDGAAVAAIGTRDCTLQRRHQKLIEIAPAPLEAGQAARLTALAERLFAGTGYRGLATAEFLIDRDRDPADPEAIAFIEVNPRLQVEHCVTEAVTGLDLVALALRLADGAMLAEALPEARERGVAIELRVNAETIAPDGTVRPSGGTIARYDPPGGPGVRIDDAGHVGFAANPRFDPLLAKVIVHGADWDEALARARIAAAEFRIDGLATNLPLLAAILDAPDFGSQRITTTWLAEARLHEHLTPPPAREVDAAAPGDVAAPLTGVLVAFEVAVGDVVRAGQPIAAIEALKMQHLALAPASGTIAALVARAGDTVAEGAVLARIDAHEVADDGRSGEEAADPDAIRPDLAEVHARHAFGLDAQRPDAVARRHRQGQRTARENLDDLFDPGSFIEYGALAIAAQRRRRSLDDLMRNTPHDGLVGGIGTVNAADHGEDRAGCLGLAYDYTVLAGTQGHINHRKTDRLLGIAEEMKLPIVFFTEGGGGRPGDVDAIGATGLDTPTFRSFAALSGMAPRIGVTTGYCFAGNAVLFGSCDVTIATEGANIGMGGPAMIEGGGLGQFAPKQIGPAAVQWANGVIDVLARDEAEATAQARAILSIFQGRTAPGRCPDQRLLRHVVPENRLRVFDIRRAIALLLDEASFIELRGGFAPGMITGLGRIEGRPIGLIANDCRHLSGAIDADGASKAARFLQLCDTFGVPIVSLCDTPGFMVGPDAEQAGSVRAGARMFVVGGAMSVPVLTVVVRKTYGLGAQAMAGGTLHAGPFTVAWPTGEFGGMGLEGAVRLGYRKELEAIADPVARDERYRALVAASYDRGKAVAVAQTLEIDAVIDPADTRRWLLRALAAIPPRAPGRRRFIDTL